MATVIKRKPGDRFGCTDTAPPSDSNDYELSRILDVLDKAPDPDKKQEYFRSLPDPVKLEFNYSRWSYVAPDPWDPRHNGSIGYPPTPKK